MKLKRKPGFSATFTKKGYQAQTVEVESKLGGGGAAAGAGNLLIGGVIGGLVDGSNGSLNNLTPNPLKVTLIPEQPAESAATTPAAIPGEALADQSAASSEPAATTPGADGPAAPTPAADAASALPSGD